MHALCPASRNLTNRQLDAIGSSDGLVGIVFACPFLRADFADDPDTPLELIATHASYVAERIGVEHVALGSDFDGTEVPDALGDVTGVPALLEEFAKHGFSESEIEAMWIVMPMRSPYASRRAFDSRQSARPPCACWKWTCTSTR